MTSYQPVTDLLADLRAAGLKADVKLEDVRLPGVWVRLTGIEPFALDGSAAIGAEVICLHGETSADRAYIGLLALYDQATAVLGEEQPARFVTVNVPEGAAVPGLSIPVQLVP